MDLDISLGAKLVTNALRSAGSIAMTFDAFGRLWTSGELAKRFPGHVKHKCTADEHEQKRDVMKPWIGHVPLTEFIPSR